MALYIPVRTPYVTYGAPPSEYAPKKHQQSPRNLTGCLQALKNVSVPFSDVPGDLFVQARVSYGCDTEYRIKLLALI